MNQDEDSNDHKRPVADEQSQEMITIEGDTPQKRFYRQRAHANPLSHNDAFNYPVSPQHMDWRALYEQEASPPTVLDIGCGFGGLTVTLCELLPEERILGLEIRSKVTEYVRLRILNLRKERSIAYNAAVLRTNSMKYFPNYFGKGSLHKIFICFPDPHFKRKNHPRRIVSQRLLSEYAYGLQLRARLYLITDVKELNDWHIAHCDAHPLFRRLFVSTGDSNAMQETDDPCVHAMRTVTEEGKKVERNKGSKYYAVYERIQDESIITSENFFAPPPMLPDSS